MWSADQRDLHARLSPAQVDFLDFVARNPEGLSPGPFSTLTRLDEFMRYPMQPWPIFLSSARRNEMAETARGIYDLIRSVPGRVFDNDPARFVEFYGVDPHLAERASGALLATDGARGLLARGDFIDTRDGFKCIEFNMVSNLGGWGNAIWADRYLQVPLIQRFLEETGIRVSRADTSLAFFRNAMDQARHSGLDDQGEVNIAFLLGEPAPAPWMAYVQSLYRQARQERGDSVAGEVLACDLMELLPGPRGLSYEGRRVHAVVELFLNGLPEVLVSAQRSGKTHVYNGPAGRILTDKSNLAVLSQLQDSDRLSPEESALIRAHIPWTRVVSSGFSDRDGERMYLPDYLQEHREELVLKRGYSHQGRDVQVGRFSSPAAWDAAVEKALEEGFWVVQEKLEFQPYLFQAPGGGSAPHDVVWGLFVFGEQYGGGFTRLTPRDSTGIINAARGATEGIFFEVLDAD